MQRANVNPIGLLNAKRSPAPPRHADDPRRSRATRLAASSWAMVVVCLLMGPLGVATCALGGERSPPAAHALRIEPARVSLHAQGLTRQLLVSGVDVQGNAFDLTHDGQFDSSNPRVATVSPTGVIRARGGGIATIRVQAAGKHAEVQVAVSDEGGGVPIRFRTDIVPILTKLGCNSGGCHGKATGQNGFKLSLLGFEPDWDYAALIKQARGRRIFPGDAMRSLTLLKATASVPHGGGKRLEADSDDYRLLHTWIQRGAAPPADDDPVLERIAVRPEQRVLAPDAKQQLLVTAYFSDGTARDVTGQAVYLSNEPDVADVDKTGLVQTKSRNGLLAVMVRFGGKIGVFHGAVPYGQAGPDRDPAAQDASRRRLADLEKTIGGSEPDKFLLAQWKRLGVVPSPVIDDAAFVRRATINICGTVPTPEEVAAYVADERVEKRARLIDRLLERPEYASYFALKWADILQNRGRGYSTGKQRAGTALLAGWIRDSIAANKPYDRFVSEILTATGSQDRQPPTVWYRSVRTTSDYVESIAQAFLGVRIQCAQCHHHPFERWSQADYYGLAAVFARVGRKGGFADAEVPTNEIIFVKDSGQVTHPRTGQVMRPRPLGGPDFAISRYDDPRRSLAKWMTAPDNPFFARTMANRMWGHFFGRGIVHPIDDARSTNPPSNPELLDGLARQFVASGYDVKHLIRVICNSYAYRLSSIPGEFNGEDRQSFARFYPRRLSAEVLLDAISQVLDVPTQFPGGRGAFPLGTRAIELPDENVPSHFLDVFGRPARTSACECERIDSPALAQALELVNSTEIQRKLTAKEGYAEALAADDKPHEDNVRDIFLRILARPPRPEEMAAATGFLQSEPDRREAYRSLLWSLLATNEFMFNH